LSVPTAGYDEEVRFAVVLNGGVSLAIWMGGVAREIDRLTRARPGDGIVVLLFLVAVAVAASYGFRRLAQRRLRLAEAETPARAVSAIWMPWYGLAFGLVAAAAYGAGLTGGDLPSWQPALATTALVFWLVTTLVAPILLLRRLS
jgi:hypothetical protein